MTMAWAGAPIRAGAQNGNLADAGARKAADSELLLDAVGADEVAGANGDEHRPRLRHAVGDPARPIGVPADEQGFVGLRTFSAHGAEQLQEIAAVAALPGRLQAAHESGETGARVRRRLRRRGRQRPEHVELEFKAFEAFDRLAAGFGGPAEDEVGAVV